VRLTLRTLLAYLDDTLDANEIRTIGQKVAESDAAQELIARIKSVTRRRRLTTPPSSGTGALDPNTVAEYLDNQMPAEEVTELEKLCLESDVHLAEVAACHQILTLVLGEPALVPPTARERMYKLVQGPESQPTRKAPISGRTPILRDEAAVPAATEQPSAEIVHRYPWLTWALPSAAGVLLVVLVAVLWKSLPTSKKSTPVARLTYPEVTPTPTRSTTQQPPTNLWPSFTDYLIAAAREQKGGPPPVPGESFTAWLLAAAIAQREAAAAPPPVAKPSTEVREVGKFISQAQVLARKGKDGLWKRVGFNARVQSGEQLLSLPGYKSEIETDGKVKVELWGNLPEQVVWPSVQELLESSVTLHVPHPKLDMELTLHRGRIYLTNMKEQGPARVRVHFWDEETWDITLDEPDSFVGLELRTNLPAKASLRSDERQVIVVFWVARKSAGLRAEYRTFGEMKPPPGQSMVMWTNIGKQRLQGPFSLQKLPDELTPRPQLPEKLEKLEKRVQAALGDLSKRIKADENVDIALAEAMEDPQDDLKRALGIRGLSALDTVTPLVDGLNEKNPQVRQECYLALRHWLRRGRDQEILLTHPETGILTKKFGKADAAVILDLLYGPTEDSLKDPEFYALYIACLKHPNPIVRDMAARWLYFLVPAGQKIPFDPQGTKDQVEMTYQRWKELIPDGKLPPENKKN